MISKNENALLFDDNAMLEANFGKGFLNAISANANCDCTSYSESNDIFFDDVSILENTLGSDALKTNSINANCDCDGYYPTINEDELDTQKGTGTAA